MILWGIEKNKLDEGELRHVTCPKCQSKTSMSYEVFGKYLYLFWVPMFPIGKKKILRM